MFKVPQEIKAEDTILSLVFFFFFTLLKEKLDKSYTHTTKQKQYSYVTRELWSLYSKSRAMAWLKIPISW